MTPTEQEKDWEESYQIQKKLTMSRLFFVAQIASDIQECMRNQRTDTVKEFIGEATYHIDKSKEEGLIDDRTAKELKLMLDAGLYDYNFRIDCLISGEVSAKKWDEYVRPSIEFMNYLKRLIFPITEKIGYKNLEE